MIAQPQPAPEPPTPDGEPTGAQLERYKRILEDWGLEVADRIAQDAESRANRHQSDVATVTLEAEMLSAIHAGYIDVVKGSLERAVDRGTFITTVVSAVATTYAALLGLVYGRIGEHAEPLPARGATPFIFLAMALAFRRRLCRFPAP